MNNSVFRKDRDTKLVTTDKRRRNQLVSVPNYHTNMLFRWFICNRNKIDKFKNE